VIENRTLISSCRYINIWPNGVGRAVGNGQGWTGTGVGQAIIIL